MLMFFKINTLTEKDFNKAVIDELMFDRIMAFIHLARSS